MELSVGADVAQRWWWETPEQTVCGGSLLKEFGLYLLGRGDWLKDF